ncbi:MAG: hypothetical protein KBC57_00255 [Neisseriaceae bacterium]|nr:hypothetical protein [Neisseriaceae bacterium]
MIALGDNVIDKFFNDSQKKWSSSGVDIFKNITKEIIALEKSKGIFHSPQMHLGVSDEQILEYDFFKILYDVEEKFTKVCLDN